MYKILASIAIILSGFSASAQQTYTVSKDPENGAKVFKGPITLADLAGEPAFDWYGKGESAYKPDSVSISYLREKLPQYSIITLMGTWCEDSQNLIPKLARTLKEAKFPMKQFTLYGVDRSKQTNGMEAKIYKVQLVPTIIVFKGNEEIGRITETVTRNIETDLAQIVQKDNP